MLLPTEKLATLTLSCVMTECLKHDTRLSPMVVLAKKIGDQIEAELNVMKFKKGKEGMKAWQRDLIKACQGNKVQPVAAKIRKILKEERMSREEKVRADSSFTSLLLLAWTSNAFYSFLNHLRLAVFDCSIKLVVL